MAAAFDRRWLTAALLTCLAGGCGTKPRAPALLDEPVYQNQQEGLRFLAPEGWKVRSRSEVPSGPLKKERLLIEYRRIHTALAANLVVAMDDVESSTELSECLAQRAARTKEWQLRGKPERIEVDGREALRAVYHLKQGKEIIAMEVAAVRRGGRVFFFTGVFTDADKKAREQVRKTVASATW